MGKKKAYIKFETEYSEEVKERLVLTSESVGGACSAGDGLWEAQAEFLASVDPESGELSEQQGSLRWLCEDKDRGDWVYDLQKLTVYRVRCREKLDKTAKEGMRQAWVNSCMLIEVVERGLRHPELDRVLEAYKKPVWLTDELCGRFQLERQFDWFSANVDWLGEECCVSLACDEEGGNTADKALAVFKKMYENREEWDKSFRAFAAEQLTESANEWLEDFDDEPDEEDFDGDDPDEEAPDEEKDSDGEAPDGEKDFDEENTDEEDSDDKRAEVITKEDFAERISIRELSVEPNGDYIAYYCDDDMFLGHIIMITGNVDAGLEDADIAG